MTSLRTHQQRLVTLSFLYLIGHAFSVHVVYPLQIQILGEQWIPVYLVFLPHAVRVLGAWLYGWTSVLYILPGVILRVLLWPPLGSGLESVVLHGIAMLTAPLSFQLLCWWQGLSGPRGRRQMTWRSIMLAGLMSAGLNAATVFLVVGYAQPLSDRFSAMAIVAMGNMLGVLLSLFILLLGFRLFERLYASRRGKGGSGNP